MVLREQEYQAKKQRVHMFMKKLAVDSMHIDSAMDTQNEILEMCNRYEEENASLKSENDELREQVRKLEARVKEMEDCAVVQPTPENTLLVFDARKNIYEGEAREIVLDILSDFRKNNHSRKRRCDIIDEILSCNECRKEPERRSHAMKVLMKGYSSMDSQINRGLAELGLKEIDVKGKQKHIKLVYGGNSRYTLTLARSGSDKREGMNAAINFRNQML